MKKEVYILGSCLDWITTNLYFMNMSQIIRIDNYKTYRTHVISGVPQGSHLDLKLFNTFIDNIPLYFSHTSFSVFGTV